MKRGLFISHSGSLQGRPRGGVQICTEEYISVIETAGITLQFCLLDVDRRLSTRIMRRFGVSSYLRPVEPDALAKIASALQDDPPELIFLNQVTLATLAPAIKQRESGNARIVVLSHGLESTDLLHNARLQHRLPLGTSASLRPAKAIGAALLAENALRAHVDCVVALSSFDVELERWLGARRVDWLPRLVAADPLEWRPIGERLGFVGTLDHAPNMEGLVEVLNRLTSADRRYAIRVVSASSKVGKWLAETFPNVDYLGPLPEDDLRREAATWNVFLHPIFCYPRGCSTKLAIALGWHLPIVTTSMGHRGYELGAGCLVVADDPSDFAAKCLRLLDTDAAQDARCGIINAARAAPSLQENAKRLQALLEN
ncbi:MAG TPA: glycosyltransferase [Hyphomicrobiaceae bacterium]|nr:glycosyltransferase [Hyphomicrobiaceae bacterium]